MSAQVGAGRPSSDVVEPADGVDAIPLLDHLETRAGGTREPADGSASTRGIEGTQVHRTEFDAARRSRSAVLSSRGPPGRHPGLGRNAPTPRICRRFSGHSPHPRRSRTVDRRSELIRGRANAAATSSPPSASWHRGRCPPAAASAATPASTGPRMPRVHGASRRRIHGTSQAIGSCGNTWLSSCR